MKNLFFILFISIAIIGNAQNLNLSFSENVNYDYTRKIVSSIKNENKLYNIRFGATVIGSSIDIYNSTDLKLIKSINFTPNGNDNTSILHAIKTIFVKALIVDNQLLVFFEHINLDEKKRCLLMQKFSLEGEFIGGLTEFEKQNTDLNILGFYDIKLLGDKKSFIVLHIKPVERLHNEIEKNDKSLNLFMNQIVDVNNDFKYNIYDNNLVILNSKSIHLETNYNNECYDWYLNSETNEIFLFNISMNYQAPKGSNRYSLFVIKINLNSNEKNELTISLPNKEINDFKIIANKESKTLDVLCLYSDVPQSKKDFTYINGFALIKINESNCSIQSQNIQKLTNQQIANITGKNIEKIFDIKDASSHIKIRDFSKRNDGSFVLIGEYIECDLNSSNNNIDGNIGTSYSVIYKNVFFCNFNSTGDILNINCIPKYQKNSNDDCSITSYNNGNKVFVLYNDNPENLEIKTEGEISKMNSFDKNTVLIAAEIKKDGSYFKSILLDNKTKNIYPLTRIAKLLDSGELLIPYMDNGPLYKDFNLNPLPQGFIKLGMK